jgi:hypothetical protein
MAMHVIILDEASDETRGAVHEVIKANAKGWWHRYPNVWMAGGDNSAADWRDMLKPLVKAPTSVLVLRLPETGHPKWAYFGPDAQDRMKWFHSNYS